MDEDAAISFITDDQIYKKVIQGAIPAARTFLWIATADIKDLHVARGKRMVPFLKVLSELVSQGVSIRLLHAKEPGPLFRRDFDKYTNLREGMERILCPRVHFKSVVVDGLVAYTGSAAATGGAGTLTYALTSGSSLPIGGRKVKLSKLAPRSTG